MTTSVSTPANYVAVTSCSSSFTFVNKVDLQISCIVSPQCAHPAHQTVHLGPSKILKGMILVVARTESVVTVPCQLMHALDSRLSNDRTRGNICSCYGYSTLMSKKVLSF